MGSLSSKNRGVKYLLSLIDIFTKNAWVKSLKDKTAKTVLDGFIEIVNMFKHKPNKLWAYLERVFYDNLIQKWLDENYILMYLTYTEGKLVVAEWFIRTLKGTKHIKNDSW